MCLLLSSFLDNYPSSFKDNQALGLDTLTCAKTCQQLPRYPGPIRVIQLETRTQNAKRFMLLFQEGCPPNKITNFISDSQRGLGAIRPWPCFSRRSLPCFSRRSWRINPRSENVWFFRDIRKAGGQCFRSMEVVPIGHWLIRLEQINFGPGRLLRSHAPFRARNLYGYTVSDQGKGLDL